MGEMGVSLNNTKWPRDAPVIEDLIILSYKDALHKFQ